MQYDAYSLPKYVSTIAQRFAQLDYTRYDADAMKPNETVEKYENVNMFHEQKLHTWFITFVADDFIMSQENFSLWEKYRWFF